MRFQPRAVLLQESDAKFDKGTELDAVLTDSKNAITIVTRRRQSRVGEMTQQPTPI